VINCRPHAGHLVGRNASPYTAAADGQAPGNSRLPPPWQGHHKIRVVISCYQLMGAEVLQLITGSLEAAVSCTFNSNPPWSAAMPMRIIYSPPSSTFSFSVPSGLHFQFLISGMSWPCLSMY